jgi:hypothetical protein
MRAHPAIGPLQSGGCGVLASVAANCGSNVARAIIDGGGVSVLLAVLRLGQSNRLQHRADFDDSDPMSLFEHSVTFKAWRVLSFAAATRAVELLS